jgi:hypothetical protein
MTPFPVVPLLVLAIIFQLLVPTVVSEVPEILVSVVPTIETDPAEKAQLSLIIGSLSQKLITTPSTVPLVAGVKVTL